MSISEKLKEMKEKVVERYFDVVEGNEQVDSEENLDNNSYEHVFEENPIDKPIIEKSLDEFISTIKEEETIEKTVEPVQEIPKEPAFISSETKIYGNIVCECDLTVKGDVTGDIISSGSLRIVDAKIVGNIKAKDIILQNSNIQGNVDSHSSFEMKDKSVVAGQIKALSGKIDGECYGNLYIEGKLNLCKCAFVKADMYIESIMIEEGALIDGKIKVKHECFQEDNY